MAWTRTHGAKFAPEKYQLMHFTRRPKKFNMQATVQIPKFQAGPVPVMRILGIHLDPKLKWGPHVRLTAAKAASHMASVTRLTRSTWGATFAQARQIYAAVIRPAMSYGCPVWFALGDERANRNRLIYPLQTVLKHEASVEPLDLHLERLAVSYSAKTENSEGDRTVEAARKAVETRAQHRFKTKGTALARQDKGKAAIGKEIEAVWTARWEEYQQQARTQVSHERHLAVAVRTPWTRGLRTKERLTKVKSTVATLLRMEHIGLNDYLFRRRVPGYAKPDCDYGCPRQTPKHIVLFCTMHTTRRSSILAEAKMSDYIELLSTEAGLRAVTKWFLQWDILTQLSLAKLVYGEKPGRRGRRPGAYVDEDDSDC
ncbi:hypothetical protein B0A55_11660 [Friedmanniomyces simplex]|uniref:Reverse transcriptase domain-containing protein n=1 Tax=Friedmanniomyces simplex TaxID=329884 RepID=A0A4U0WVW7_9PEZI|nr:hypothetical protein B0A55_11660 [Friedmanniomyces simplex]